MNWIVASFLMFLSAVVMYLLVRYATRIHISAAMQNVSMFIVPLLVYITLATTQRTRLALTPWEWFIMIFAAIVFSYLGSRFSMDSIVESPNPGYSLMISKSYVVMTAIASVFLFHQVLNIKSAVAILLIVGFSSLIMIDPRVHQHNIKVKNRWLPLAIGAFICWGGVGSCVKIFIEYGCAGCIAAPVDQWNCVDAISVGCSETTSAYSNIYQTPIGCV
jgi:hypothetical protein